MLNGIRKAIGLTMKRTYESLNDSSDAHGHKNGSDDESFVENGNFTINTSRLVDESTPKYPPYLKGIPAKTIQDIIDSQKDLLYKIKYLTEESEWNDYYSKVIFNFIKYAHLLPASESNHHRGIGGLTRHGLEVGYHALYSSEDKVAGNNLFPSDRRNFIKRWRFAIFCAGLCHDIGKPLTDITITSNDGLLIWNPYTGSLYDWLKSGNLSDYNIVWRKGREGQHAILGPMIAYQVIGRESMAWISGGTPELPYDMTEALMGTEGRSNLIRDMVRNADVYSVAKDLRELASQSFGDIGLPVERFILDAARRLSSKYQNVNKKGSMFWIINSDLYLIWPRASSEILDILKKDNIPGIPKDPDTIADILIDRSLAIATEDRASRIRYWSLSNCSEMGIAVKQKALKLSSVNLIFDSEPDSVFGHCLPFRSKSSAENNKENEGAGGIKADSNPNKKTIEVKIDESEHIENDDIYDEFIERLSSKTQIIIKTMNKKYSSNIKGLSFINSEEKLNVYYPKGFEGLGLGVADIIRSFNDDGILSTGNNPGLKLTKAVVDVSTGESKQVIIFNKIATEYISKYVDPDSPSETTDASNDTNNNNSTGSSETALEVEKTHNTEQVKNNTSSEKVIGNNGEKQDEKSDISPASTGNPLIDFAKKNQDYKKICYGILSLFKLIKEEKEKMITKKISADQLKFPESRISNKSLISVETDTAIKFLCEHTGMPRGDVEAKISRLISDSCIKAGSLTTPSGKVQGIAISLEHII
jgi:hypothetical protein